MVWKEEIDLMKLRAFLSQNSLPAGMNCSFVSLVPVDGGPNLQDLLHFSDTTINL